jgi:hypothetical protein
LQHVEPGKSLKEDHSSILFRLLARSAIAPNQFRVRLLCDRYTLELFGLPCPPPTLHIAKQATNALLHWSSAYPDYRLQIVNSLNGTPPPFLFASNAPALLNGGYIVTNALTGPHQFFRLAK